MYAIIEDSGTQIKVQEGDVLDLDLRQTAEGEDAPTTLTLDRVLMIGDAGADADRRIGTPYVDGASVTAEVVDEVKGDKLHVIKFKRRKGYRRKIGHRQRYLRVKVTGISA